MFSLLIRHFQLQSAVVHGTPEGAVDLESAVEETEVRHRESQRMLLAVQDSSISDIVGLSVGRSEPTNNQSLGSIKE